MLTTKKDIKNWLKMYDITDYVINEDMTVDVHGDVVLFRTGIDSIDVQFYRVDGFFDCSENELTSLKGCPTIVEGGFNCSGNQLTTLEYCPEVVGAYFDCSNNQLTSLELLPNDIKGKIDYSGNCLKD